MEGGGWRGGVILKGGGRRGGGRRGEVILKEGEEGWSHPGGEVEGWREEG